MIYRRVACPDDGDDPTTTRRFGPELISRVLIFRALGLSSSAEERRRRRRRRRGNFIHTIRSRTRRVIYVYIYLRRSRRRLCREVNARTTPPPHTQPDLTSAATLPARGTNRPTDKSPYCIESPYPYTGLITACTYSKRTYN